MEIPLGSGLAEVRTEALGSKRELFASSRQNFLRRESGCDCDSVSRVEL